MAVHLQQELDELKKDLLYLSGMVEEAVGRAVRSLRDMDRDLAKEVMDQDQKIDLKEVEIEEECLKILALHQPVAVDLRFVVAVLKINSDLERVGDLAVNIAERARFLGKQKDIEFPFSFDEMAEKTRAMLKKSIDSMVKFSAQMADEVCNEDDEVDAMNRDMYKKVYEEIRRNPENVEALVHYLSVSRHLERIADYATNIAEDIIYMVEGTIVRHSPEEYDSLT